MQHHFKEVEGMMAKFQTAGTLEGRLARATRELRRVEEAASLIELTTLLPDDIEVHLKHSQVCIKALRRVKSALLHGSIT